MSVDGKSGPRSVGSGVITLKQLALLAEVSEATVSRALRDDPQIPKRTCKRIKNLAAEHGYLLNRVGRSLTHRRTGTVSLILPGTDLALTGEFAPAFARAVTDRDYAMQLYVHGADPAEELASVRRALEHRVDGLVICPTWPSPEVEAADLLRRSRVPHVSLRWVPYDPPQDSVVFDFIEGGRLAGEHLCSLGHQRVGVVGYNWAMLLEHPRMIGFRRAFARSGIRIDEEAVVAVAPAGRHVVESVVQNATQLLQRFPDITAVYCFNAYLALGVLQAADRLGRGVPEDLSLVCDGGWRDLDYSKPLLTKITLDQAASARATAEFITQRIEERLAGQWPPEPKRVLLPVSLRVGESTAPPAETREEGEEMKDEGVLSLE